MSLLEQIQWNIQKHRLLPRRGPIVVAVSGGVDSMVLLHVLSVLAREDGRGLELLVAHFNHRLRGRSSDADQRLVERTARQLGWLCVTGQGDVKKLAEEQGTSLEMAGRQLRHEFLAETARQAGSRCIALAHHADDQVELFFLRLLRGSGSEGLAGMTWDSPSPVGRASLLIRPLLDQPKSVLLEYARQQRIQFREDSTNVSQDFLRNRIRQELIPLLERNYQPALSKVLLRQMEILRDESDYLHLEAEAWMKNPVHPDWANCLPALQRYVLRMQLHELGIRPNFDLIEALRSRPGIPLMVEPGRTICCRADGSLRCAEVRRAEFDRGFSVVSLAESKGQASFAGKGFRWIISPQRSPALPRLRVGRECFDADLVGRKVILRHWQPGDRFQPIGMDRAVKLQDLFTNLKIPQAMRRNLVVATTEKGELWWVEGIRIAEPFKLTSRTKRRLEWSWKKLPGRGSETKNRTGSVE